MAEETASSRRQPSAAVAVVSFLAIVAVLVVLINLNVDTTMSLFVATIMAALVAFALKIPWKETESVLLKTVADCIPTFIIVIMVGMLVGIWIAGGTVPALMYYGMKIVSPSILVPLAFILCFLTSEFTGTSFGSIATMGVAFVGIASTTNIPMALVIGAVVCGAWFGDRMSPMSDTTNLASGVSRVPLYTHINSMLYSAVPAAVIAFVMFAIAGIAMGGGHTDPESQQIIMNALTENYNMSIWLVLPALMVLVVSALRMPAFLGFGLTIIVSVIFAMLTQGVGFVDIMNYAANGFSIETGAGPMVDNMLNRGGISSMTVLLVTFMVASLMGGIIKATGILEVIANEVLLKVIKGKTALVVVTLIYGYVVNFLAAGGQTVSIIVTQQTFEEAYERLNVDRRVLSRCLEDSATLSAPIVPWGVATLFVMATLGCGLEYIPYCWFIFLVPIAAVVCAATNIGMWDADGNRMWGKYKGMKGAPGKEPAQPVK
ncbi:Malate-2H(+)/Na(+)-lactate antiporter [Slackia heliotrinireducens]|uniref:Na+ antiporter NhaC n=1 Tax=Slackia heliotrinireducens (strain ATCC 29202 / DSM 20476 / NCTC 11029 / RHS 1) TaxID=471855 RepID=C7N774_SLAHD|nr:Na+/H+ antiporter NhaC [Slackia heliotrinireducens]ACV22759.1 Na+ antiporter NhaC [Slackia heliotrinireducens DSM 20476]VEH01424.1 Malate-2H(+)/Na(+)-lactate antiporter [Slackia heliotrinireducens]